MYRRALVSKHERSDIFGEGGRKEQKQQKR
jgi:hypothetical protein